MNELITPERGVLVEHVRREPQRLATNYHVAEQTLERGVRQVMGLTDEMKDTMRKNGRKFFENNDSFFRQSFVDIIEKVINE